MSTKARKLILFFGVAILITTFFHSDLFSQEAKINPLWAKVDQLSSEVESKSIDIIYLYSVFSHTTEEDFRVYLEDFSRILDDNGKIFFTTFVEEDVPDFSINPENYRLKCSGPLHIVRYKKDYLFSILEEYGFSVMSFTYNTEADGQSAIYLSKKAG